MYSMQDQFYKIQLIIKRQNTNVHIFIIVYLLHYEENFDLRSSGTQHTRISNTGSPTPIAIIRDISHYDYYVNKRSRDKFLLVRVSGNIIIAKNTWNSLDAIYYQSPLYRDVYHGYLQLMEMTTLKYDLAFSASTSH